jgi:thiol-disulfide isomerase/thioredoxin
VVGFGVSIQQTDAGLSSTIHSGGQSWQIPETGWRDETLTFSMPVFDATITATAVEGSPQHTRFVGRYRRVRDADTTADLEFRMTPPLPDPPLGDASPFVGRWRLRFADSDQDAVGIFQGRGPGPVTGTILTTTGDYRYLGGGVDRQSGRLELSAFDGGHVFHITAEAVDDDSIAGEFWSGDWYHVAWSAKRDPDADLPSGFDSSRVVESFRLGELKFPDLQGNLRALDDPSLMGSVTIIELFGSWCPNCHDAASLLADLQIKYREKGLKTIGLAFELTGDAERDRRQVDRYVKRYGVQYPVLIAGLADKEKASAAFPVLDAVRAFPTFLFLDAEGRVRATYTGFSGPATGQAYERLKSQFDQTIQRLLDESP